MPRRAPKCKYHFFGLFIIFAGQYRDNRSSYISFQRQSGTGYTYVCVLGKIKGESEILLCRKYDVGLSEAGGREYIRIKKKEHGVLCMCSFVSTSID